MTYYRETGKLIEIQNNTRQFLTKYFNHGRSSLVEIDSRPINYSCCPMKRTNCQNVRKRLCKEEHGTKGGMLMSKLDVC